MATTWTNRGLQRLGDGSFNPAGLTMALLTTVSAQATIRDWNVATDLVGELTVGQAASYTRRAVPTVTVTEGDTADNAVLTHGDVAFGSLETGATVTGVAVLMGTEVMWVADLPAGIPLAAQPTVVRANAAGAATIAHA